MPLYTCWTSKRGSVSRGPGTASGHPPFVATCRASQFGDFLGMASDGRLVKKVAAGPPKGRCEYHALQPFAACSARLVAAVHVEAARSRP
jgi:hypothetical protein